MHWSRAVVSGADKTVELYRGRDIFKFDLGHVIKNQPITKLGLLSNGLGIQQKQIITMHYLAGNPAWGRQSLRGRTVYSNWSPTCGPVDQAKPTKCVKSQYSTYKSTSSEKKRMQRTQSCPWGLWVLVEIFEKCRKNEVCLQSCSYRRMEEESFHYSEFKWRSKAQFSN